MFFNRCTDIKQFQDYYDINEELYQANETQIYDRTGCLSNCDKFYYDAQPMTDIVVKETEYADETENIPAADSVPLLNVINNIMLTQTTFLEEQAGYFITSSSSSSSSFLSSKETTCPQHFISAIYLHKWSSWSERGG